MKKIKVMSVLGTRPEAIKMARVIKILENNKFFQSVLTISAQHRELLDEVLELFHLSVDYDLDIMETEQSLERITTKILVALKRIITRERPDLILVHGDTTTAFTTALAAFYHQTKLAHIEAGLRSYNKYEPFPEEMNRRLTSSLADIHFAPTKNDYNNLIQENISGHSIFITGNTVIDAVLKTVETSYQFNNDTLANLNLEDEKIILLTAHRRENLGQKLKKICQAILDLVVLNSEVTVVFPVHPNPKVREIVYSKLDNQKQIYLLDPLSYPDFINLLARCYLVLTDSGGIQEEAPALDKPVLVLRDTTERQAGLEAGTIKLIGTDNQRVVREVNDLLNKKRIYKQMIEVKNPYGDGKSSKRIVDYLLYYFNLKTKKPLEFSHTNSFLT